MYEETTGLSLPVVGAGKGVKWEASNAHSIRCVRGGIALCLRRGLKADKLVVDGGFSTATEDVTGRVLRAHEKRGVFKLSVNPSALKWQMPVLLVRVAMQHL